jgi:hypothetical protein
MSADKLQQALKFTDADINANREGKITQSQAERLSNTQVGLGKFSAAIVIFGILILFVIHTFANLDNDATTLYTIVVLILCAILAPTMFGNSVTIRQDVEGDQVVSVQGIVRKRYSVKTGYNLYIGQIRFSIFRHTYNSFEDGAMYKIYFIPNSKTILSAEIVE